MTKLRKQTVYKNANMKIVYSNFNQKFKNVYNSEKEH